MSTSAPIPNWSSGNAFDMPGGPAFPISIPGVGDNGAQGMSLRDYFAAHVLGHLLDAASYYTTQVSGETLAKHSYAVADAMLLERAK